MQVSFDFFGRFFTMFGKFLTICGIFVAICAIFFISCFGFECMILFIIGGNNVFTIVFTCKKKIEIVSFRGVISMNVSKTL